jgi:hypothetical protein
MGHEGSLKIQIFKDKVFQRFLFHPAFAAQCGKVLSIYFLPAGGTASVVPATDSVFVYRPTYPTEICLLSLLIMVHRAAWKMKVLSNVIYRS